MSRLRIVAICVLLLLAAAGALKIRADRTEPAATATTSVSHPAAPPPPPVISTSDSESSSTSDTTQGAPIKLLGVVRSDASDTLTSRMPVRIAGVFVHEGDAATRGQLLVQLDDSDARAQERTAEGALGVAQAQVRRAAAGRDAQRAKLDADVLGAHDGLTEATGKLRQAKLARDTAVAELDTQRTSAKSAVSKAEAGLKRATETLTSLEDLSKVGGVSRSDLESARLQASLAQSDLDSVRAAAKALDSGPPAPAGTPPTPYRIALADEDVDAANAGVLTARQGVKTAEEARRRAMDAADQEVSAANAGVTQAQSGVSSALAAEAQYRMTASISGIASAVGAHVGETAQPGMPLVTLVSVTGLYVEALVPARQLAHLRVGQPCSVSVDTRVAAASSNAHIQSVARIAEPDGRTFRVRFAIANTAALHPGQTARITISQPRSGL